MAWNRGNLTWTFSFKSLNNVSCRVDIYHAGSTLQTPITLTPSADPFSYEEDDDSDILNNTVRYKTGYIRLIETETQPLSGLIPMSDTENYVEFYYGSKLDFVGFMQCQNFSNDFSEYPREVSFPVASPLWALSNRKFDMTFNGVATKPHSVSLGSLIDKILSNSIVNGIYENVMFPYFSDVKLDNTIYSLVFCPWNRDFNHVDQNTDRNPIYSPETYGYLLDAICKAFGWVLHDDVRYLTFSMFDYKQRYAIYPVGHVGDPDYLDTTNGEHGGTPVELTDSLTFCDSSAKEEQILPFSNIKIDFEGDAETSQELSYDRTYYIETDQYGNAVFCCFLNHVIATGELPVATGGGFENGGGGRFAYEGVHIIAFYTIDSTDIREGIAYALKSNEQDGNTLFTVRLYTKLSSLNWHVEYTLESGATLSDLSQDDTDHRYGKISVIGDHGDGYVDFRFYVSRVANAVQPYSGQWYNSWDDRDVMFFSGIRFYVNDEDRFAKYTSITNENEMIVGSNQSFDDAELTMPISMYRNNDHMIGSTVRQTMLTDYSYLLNPRNQMKALFKVDNDISHVWCKMWKYYVQAWRWRVIAYSFDPWNDEVKLTMQRSTTLQ